MVVLNWNHGTPETFILFSALATGFSLLIHTQTPTNRRELASKQKKLSPIFSSGIGTHRSCVVL